MKSGPKADIGVTEHHSLHNFSAQNALVELWFHPCFWYDSTIFKPWFTLVDHGQLPQLTLNHTLKPWFNGSTTVFCNRDRRVELYLFVFWPVFDLSNLIFFFFFGLRGPVGELVSPHHPLQAECLVRVGLSYDY